MNIVTLYENSDLAMRKSLDRYLSQLSKNGAARAWNDEQVLPKIGDVPQPGAQRRRGDGDDPQGRQVRRHQRIDHRRQRHHPHFTVKGNKALLTNLHLVMGYKAQV